MYVFIYLFFFQKIVQRINTNKLYSRDVGCDRPSTTKEPFIISTGGGIA